MSMEEWTGFELSERVIEEATRWIAALDDIDNSGDLTNIGAEQQNAEEHYLHSDLQHVNQNQQRDNRRAAEGT
jgi:hypothetical protein